MQKYIFLIGSTDDFEDLEDLKRAYFDSTLTDYNASAFEFEVPESHDRGIAFLVGCGIAFGNKWRVTDTFFTLLEA
jgi:hypothetical protein